MTYYLQVNQDGIITDATTYPVEGYAEHLADTPLQAGINGGWWKLENGVLIEQLALKPMDSIDLNQRVIDLELQIAQLLSQGGAV